MVGFGQQSIFLLPGLAAVATAPASLVASDMFEAAKVSQGAMEQPSGRLPSDLHRPMGPSVDGTFIAASDLCMMVLIAACLEKRPWLLMQLSP